MASASRTHSGGEKGNKRLHFLKKVGFFLPRLCVAYSVFVEAVLTFGSVCWPGSATGAQKKTLRKIVTAASKL